jgi:excinuclease ABC subunit A
MPNSVDTPPASTDLGPDLTAVTTLDDNPGSDGFVRVRGARENNLNDVNVDVPRDAIVAFTGVSGSGKSSLAFGTIFAEAQRRFFESVAPYARRLIQQGHTPHVDLITGLPPAVALQQRRGSPSSRSTVGTVTTLSNSMRMLYSRAGTYPAGSDLRLDSDAFSPNTATGACPECHGLGIAHTVTEKLLVPDASLSIRDGAIAAWPGAWQGKNLRDVTAGLGYDIEAPWSSLPREARDWLLYTDEQPVVEVTPQRDRVAKPYKGRFWSAKSFVMHTLADSKSAQMREKVLAFVETGPCRLCGGSGLKKEALAVLFAGRPINELNALTLSELAEVLRPTAELVGATGSHRSIQSGEVTEVAVTVAGDLVRRLSVLVDLGLGYLSLNRATPTLSPGEMQRLRIATQLRSGLFGVIYVLDEPSAGLHPADAEPLLVVLEQLKASGNSVFVVEHNMDVVRRADWLVDVGPRAGDGGGDVLYSGPVAGLAEVTASVTRDYLFPGATGATTTPHREPTGWLGLTGVSRHNLVDLDVSVPLGVFTAVTGVSGSGKSTLVSKVLADAVGRELRQGSVDAVPAGGNPDADSTGATTDEDEAGTDRATTVVESITGAGAIDRLVRVDQKPIGRTPRSTPPTPASSTPCAPPSRRRMRPKRPASAPAGSPSTWPAVAVTPARARVSSPSSCSSSPAATHPAPPAAAPATTPRPSRCSTTASPSPTSSASPSTRPPISSPTFRAPRAAWRPCARWAWVTSASASRPQSSPAAKPSASSSPPSCSGRAAGTRCTCSTSPPPACTRPTSTC